MGFCHQKELFRIGSKSAFYLPVFETTRKERFLYILRKPSIPPLVLSIIGHGLHAELNQIIAKNKKYCIKKKYGVRGQVLRMKSNNRFVISDSGRRAILFITGTTIKVHLEQGKQL